MPPPRVAGARPRDDPEAVAREARAVIARMAPASPREPHWQATWTVGRDLVCAVGAHSAHASVIFWRGSALAREHPILEGTGKDLRHVKLRRVEDARSPAFRALLRAAFALDRREPPRPGSPYRSRAREVRGRSTPVVTDRAR